MADIELMIKLPEEDYRTIKNRSVVGDLTIPYVFDAIRNGKRLPKGHGRLIDADTLKKDDEVTEWISLNPVRTGKTLKSFSELFIKKIDATKTIIEADKESEE